MEFHSKYFRPDDATIIVVGDISPGLILPKLDAIFDHWKKGNALSVSFPGVKQATERRIYFVDKPGAAQSEIRIGRIGVSRTTDDYFPLIVMNTILGGSFSSRLNQNLREKHGYTYGAGSAFDFRLLPGPFYATAAVQTDATDKALTEFMNELNGILQPIPEEEVERAKNYVALGYPQNFESVAQIAGELSDLAVFNLPDDYFNSYTKNILAVTKADVERVAKKYIDPNAVDIIIVGDKSVVGQKVAALKIAPITSLTIDEVLGPAPVVEDK